ncbi:MAG TPA: LysR substrate-binding domain-containing protein [Albitalea sp.]
MRKLLPPTHLLRAFITTARCGSVVQAAAELHVTAGAVSKQLAELERWLGMPLFERVKKRLLLNATGARYLAQVQPLVDQIEAATFDLVAGTAGADTLTLSALPTFGAKWLFPRLPDFQRRFPDVELRFLSHLQGYDFSHPELDCAIRYGDGHWPGAEADYLIGRESVLIAPPRELGLPRLREPADIRHYTLVHQSQYLDAWADWCELHGVHGINTLAGPRLEIAIGVISAVRSGMGLALLPRFMVEDDIAAGALQAPFDEPLVSSRGYFACYPESKVHLPALSRFRQWLRECVPPGTR